MLATKEITKKYGVTRQTINNWIKQGHLQRPKKDNKNNWLWTNEHEKELKQIILMKNIKAETIIQPTNYLKIHNRRYLGSKQKMLNFIDEVVSNNTENVNTVADVFGGTGVVANLFRNQEKCVIVNDILYSNYISFETWFGNENVDYEKVEAIIGKLNRLPGIEGYATKNFGDKYFTMDNARKIDSIREEIEQLTNVNSREKAFVLTSLLYAMDKVANTVGHFDAYRQKMDSLSPLFLRVPQLNINSNNQIYNMDANQLVRNIEVDLVYIDTPYNSRGYESAYHVLENVAEWKKPAVEGVAMKAINRSEKGSDYTKSKAPQAFNDLIQHINAKYILVSYNNMAKKGNSRSNAKISDNEIIDTLKTRGRVQIFETNFTPFTTGKSKTKDHKELLYLCEVGIES